MNETTQYEVLRPIGYKGDRVERGTVLDLTAEEVQNIGSENLKAVDETVETPAEATPETPETETPATSEAETTPAETSSENAGEVEAPATETTEAVPAAKSVEGADQPQA